MASLDKGSLDKINMELYISLGYIPRDLETDSTGIKYTTNAIQLSSSLLRRAKAIYFESGLQQLTGGTVNIRLYCRNEGAVKAYRTFTSAYHRNRTNDILNSLTAGHEVEAQFEVASAGGAGSVGGGCEPKLIIVLG